MATYSMFLRISSAWRIPGTAEPGGLPAVYGVQSRTRLKQLSSSIGTKEQIEMHSMLEAINNRRIEAEE